MTRGFGAVFTDIDLANTTSITLFGVSNNLLGAFFVPATTGSSETFSFLGISFADPIISRVRITSGNAALGAGITDQNGDLRDLVVMDDFLYGEPSSVPETGISILLFAFALIALEALRRKSRSCAAAS